MATRFQIRNTTTNVTLAQVDIPDAAVTKIQQVFPPPGSADAALAFIMRHFREYVQRTVLAARQTADSAAIQSGQTAEQATFDAAWPP